MGVVRALRRGGGVGSRRSIFPPKPNRPPLGLQIGGGAFYSGVLDQAALLPQEKTRALRGSTPVLEGKNGSPCQQTHCAPSAGGHDYLYIYVRLPRLFTERVDSIIVEPMFVEAGPTCSVCAVHELMASGRCLPSFAPCVTAGLSLSRCRVTLWTSARCGRKCGGSAAFLNACR